MTTITDHLEPWANVAPTLPEKDQGLLIGNGASVALWPRFQYQSLYEMAQDATKQDHLEQPEIDLFSAFETENFEAVLSAMITAGKIWVIYNKPKRDIDDLRESYQRVRESLIRVTIWQHRNGDYTTIRHVLKLLSALVVSFPFTHCIDQMLIEFRRQRMAKHNERTTMFCKSLVGK